MSADHNGVRCCDMVTHKQRFYLLVCCCFHLEVSRALSGERPVVSPRPVRSVAIIGCGISSLATAHALSSLMPDLETSIFERRPGLDPLVGAGIQLNGGLKVLGDINPDLQKAVRQAGMPLERIRSRSRDADNRLETLLDLSIQDTIRSSGVHGLLDADGEVLWTTIMRGTLQETLFDHLPQSIRRRVQFRKSLADLLIGPDGKVFCGFEDGSKEGPFDIIIGCDGIKSAVKEHIERGLISADASQREGKATGIYTGIRIRYAVQLNAESKSTSSSPVTLTQHFGRGCYCLDGAYGASASITKSVFAIFLDNEFFGPFRRHETTSSAQEENADWSQDCFKTDDGARSVMIRQLQDANIAEDHLISTIQKSDRFFELGVYAHNPFCRWFNVIPESDRVYAVLCGDAAHALPPFLGQGANMAIQDAFCLATKISEYNKAVAELREEVDLKNFLKEYESTRWAPNFEIFLKASFLGYLETGGFDGNYSRFRDSFFKTMAWLGVAKKVLLDAATPRV